LESLSLRGNPFNESAAAALGALLGSGAQALRNLNLASCRLEDASGVCLGTGLATNTGLEVLYLRDNLLREAAGRTIADALRKHTVLLTLSLELNSIDFRFLHRIKQLLERNARLRERGRPKFYRRRIDELEECQREVKVLAATLKKNKTKKQKAKSKQASMLQELEDSRIEEERRGHILEEKLWKVQELRRGVDADIAEETAKYRDVMSKGDFDVSNLRTEINGIEDKIKHHKRHMDRTRVQLENFERQAAEELVELREELGKKEKERDISSASSEAAHRHLDNYAASMKSIEPDISGGADPRLRVIEQEQKAVAKLPAAPAPKAGAKVGAVSKAAPKPKPPSSARQPVAANAAAAAKASP